MPGLHPRSKDEHRLLIDHIGLDYLDRKKQKQRIHKSKKKKEDIEKNLVDVKRRISQAKGSPRPPEMIEEELKILRKEKKGLSKKLHHRKKKVKALRKELEQFDRRFDLSYAVEEVVNEDGLFRTQDIRFITNGSLDIAIHTIARMLNHAKPNFRKIASLLESIIGNLSLCYIDPRDIDLKMVEILSDYYLKCKPILDVIDPFAVVLYNKFLILSHLDNAAIVYECDHITHSTKFSNCYRRYCEGKYPFDQFVDFSKFQSRYMSRDQQLLFSQYQRIIRVMEDMGYVDCKSGKLKQKVRNGLRDLGIRKDQIGQIVHYAYDKSLDAARNYYSKKDPNLEPMFDYLGSISKFSPDYAGELYAMDKF